MIPVGAHIYVNGEEYVVVGDDSQDGQAVTVTIARLRFAQTELLIERWREDVRALRRNLIADSIRQICSLIVCDDKRDLAREALLHRPPLELLPARYRAPRCWQAAVRPRRPQARSCRVDRRQQKRRRFVQRLRASLRSSSQGVSA